MSNTNFIRRLRPHLFTSFKCNSCSPTTAFSVRAFAAQQPQHVERRSKDVTHDYEKRVAQLESHKPLSESYPRLLDGDHLQLSPESGKDLQPGETDKLHTYTIMGTERYLNSERKMGDR